MSRLFTLLSILACARAIPTHEHPNQALRILHTTAVILYLLILVALLLVACHVIRRRVIALRSQPQSKRPLSDESWVSPDLDSQRRLVLVTTPVCTPTGSDFGSRLDDLVRVPSPVYIPPPSPSLSYPARLSRPPSSTFTGSPVNSPTLAHLVPHRPSTPTYSQTGRDTFSTVTTAETDTDTICAVPRVLSGATEGTWWGLKVRLSDASEHARYRWREGERQQEKEYCMRV